jgi:glycosyltransferase involved in cell wall biosynthesis
MVQSLLDGKYEHAHLIHVRMTFSKNLSDMRKPAANKLTHLARLIYSIALARIRYAPQILYFPPSGPNRVSFYRDVVILALTRWMFRGTIFHFHAGGISSLYPSLNRFERTLFRLAYNKPTLSIRVSEKAPDDGSSVHAMNSIVVPNGVPDAASRHNLIRNRVPGCILFVGLLCESKGVLVAIEAVSRLIKKGVPCHIVFLGEWQSPAFERRTRELVKELGVEKGVQFRGVITGTDKERCYLEADILCFPTFFESETFGLVILEAMQFALPVVSTNWRGIPSIVEDGKMGFLVPVRNSVAVADALEHLIRNPEQARQMGEAGREKYLNQYTLEKFHKAMDVAFELAGQACGIALYDGSTNTQRV